MEDKLNNNLNIQWKRLADGLRKNDIKHHGKKRSSVQVSLAILGGIVLSGCSRMNTYQYKDIEDCKKDWGEQECKENGSYRHYGGSYYYRNRATQENDLRAKHSQNIIRGGFGSRFSGGRS